MEDGFLAGPERQMGREFSEFDSSEMWKHGEKVSPKHACSTTLLKTEREIMFGFGSVNPGGKKTFASPHIASLPAIEVDKRWYQG